MPPSKGPSEGADHGSDAEKLSALYSGGFESDFIQGQAGICYFIAALDSLKRHPIGRSYVLELFERAEAGPGGWDVHFPSESQAEGVTEKDLRAWTSTVKASKAVLGDSLIERAYARFVQRKYPEHGEATVRLDSSMSFESGAPKYLFRDLVGIRDKREVQVPIESLSSGFFFDGPDADLKVFSLVAPLLKDLSQEIVASLDPVNLERYRQCMMGSLTVRPDSVQYPIKDIDGKDWVMNGNHAYAVRKIDPKRRAILVANPHDTKNKQFWLSEEQIRRYFMRIDIGTFLPSDRARVKAKVEVRPISLPSASAVRAVVAPAVAGAMLTAHEAMRLLPEEVLDLEVKETEKAVTLKSVDAAPDGYVYSAAGEVMRRVPFTGASSTGEVQNRYVALYERINRAPQGQYFFFDAVGNLLEDPIPLPNDLKVQQGRLKRVDFEPLLQVWLNENRKRLLPDQAVCPSNFDMVGYPLVATPTLPKPNASDNADAEGDANSSAMIGVVMDRLQGPADDGTGTPRYFEGKTTSIFDTITQIAQAYDVPVAIALGLLQRHPLILSTPLAVSPCVHWPWHKKQCPAPNRASAPKDLWWCWWDCPPPHPPATWPRFATRV